MGFADTLLSTGERVVHREKQHWFVFVWGARFSILAIVLAAVLLWLSTNLSGDGISGSARDGLRLIVVAMFVAGLAVLAWTALRYRSQEYVLTNRRVMQVGGVLNKHSADSSLEKINDAVLTQSIFGRMLDFGDLEVLTASDIGIDKFKMIRGPIDFKKAMLDAKHEYEVDMERQSWPPSPPLKPSGPDPFTGDAGTTVAPTPALAAAPAAAAPTPAAAEATPAAAAPPVSDPDDVTRTLASLADLRDRGAITAEEYEAKKADLLGRL
jgi:Bacterial PH domain/Short C-terminal domain